MRKIAPAARRLGLLLGSEWCRRTIVSVRRYPEVTTSDILPDNRRKTEKLWRDFFSDTSQWWDNRWEKVIGFLALHHPDFKHKKTRELLWLEAKFNPPWVEAELEKITPRTVQLDISVWNKWLARYVKDGNYVRALLVFHQMQHEGMTPNTHSFVAALNACSSLRNLEEGSRIHAQIVNSGCTINVHVGNGLVDMYAKCGSIEGAWRVFQKMSEHDAVSCYAIIVGYVRSGQGRKALEIFKSMQRRGIEPDSKTYVVLLHACASISALGEGRRVHEDANLRGRASNTFVGNSLIDMYAQCGSIEDAEKVFHNLPRRDVDSWNSMILGYVKCGEGQKGLKIFGQMPQEVYPDPITFVGALNACASVGALEDGRRIHEEIRLRGLESHELLSRCLVDM